MLSFIASIFLGLVLSGFTLGFVTSKTKSLKTSFAAGTVVFILFTGIWNVIGSMMTVDSGHVKVTKVFGEVQQHSYRAGGPYMVNPLAEAISINVRRKSYDYEPIQQGDNSTAAISKDSVPMRIQATFPVSIHPEYAWKLYEKVGTNKDIDEVIKKATFSAVRSATAEFKWRNMATKNRDEFVKTLGRDFEKTLTEDLGKFGFNKKQAESAFVVASPRVRRILPPNRVQVAISKKEASQEELKRQKTLKKIAQKKADRRAISGTGVKRMIKNLPSDMTPTELTSLISAMNNRERAFALSEVAKQEQVKWVITPSSTGDSLPSVPLKK